MEDTPVARDGSFSWETLAGKGRIIISASAANEVALETPGGHGLLSSAILEAMQSSQETVDLLGVMGRELKLETNGCKYVGYEMALELLYKRRRIEKIDLKGEAFRLTDLGKQEIEALKNFSAL